MPNNSLRLIREKKGLTLAQLAGKTSISIRTLQMYETGERSISGDDLRKLTKVLFSSNAELLQPSADLPPPPRPEPAAPATPPPAEAPAETPSPAPPVAALAQPSPSAPPGATAAPPSVRSGVNGEETGGEDRPPPAPSDFVRRPAPPFAPSAPGRPGSEPGEYRRPWAAAPGPRHAPRPPREARPREPRPARPPGPMSKGQLEQIHHFARRMGLDDAAVEERIGRSLSALDHFTAKQAIAKLHQELEESGVWQPRVGEGPDQEAAYLGKLRDRGVALVAELIDGRRVEGAILDFTPYAILLRQGDGNEVMVRKLAIAYYQTKGPVNDSE